MPQKQAPSGGGLFLRRCFTVACGGYTCLSLLILAGFLLLIFPTLEKPLSVVLLGGIPVLRHGVLFGAALLCGILFAAIRVKRVPRKPTSSLPGYFRRVTVWYTVFMAGDILCYGFYLDTLYNPYAVTEAVLLKGPSFVLMLLFLVLSMILPFLNLLLPRRKKKQPLLRGILYALLLLALIGVLFQLVINGFGSPKNYLIFTACFTGFYAFGWLMLYCFRSAQAKDENEEQEYTDLYMTDELRRQRAADAAREEKRKANTRRKS